jgi:hypothetical protein
MTLILLVISEPDHFSRVLVDHFWRAAKVGG